MTEQELFDQVWAYYYGKHFRVGADPHDVHIAAADEIRSLDLTDLRVLKNGRVFIKLRRPGILIGAKGDNIVNLQKYLQITNDDDELKVHIEEETTATIADRLIPWEYYGEDW